MVGKKDENDSWLFVEIWRGFDPLLARMMKDALSADGIPARIRGMENPALIGVGQYALGVSVDVPASDAARATALIIDLSSARDPVEEDQSQPPARTPEINLRDRRVTALIVGLTGPGFDQIIMYRGYAGLCILVGIFLSFIPSVAMRSPLYFGLTYLFSIPVDTLAGQFAAGALARNERMSVRRQLMLGLSELAIVQIAVAITAHVMGVFS